MPANPAPEESFTTTVTVEQTPEEVYAAITNVRGWWSEDIDGPTDTVGQAFVYRNEPTHRCTIRVTELVPDARVVWFVEDNVFDFTQDQTEWNGTEVHFDIARKGDKTEIRFSHVGLVAGYECFDVCSGAWDFYIHTSLRGLIRTGQGVPNRKDRPHTIGGINEMSKSIQNKAILVTGANRGIGRALVDEALERGAKVVYAGSRQPFTHPDERVVRLALDVTDEAQIRAAAERVESLDVLVNNAGVAPYDDLTDRRTVEQAMAVNFFGPYAVTQAFLPHLVRSEGALVNNVSLMALAPLPLTPSYAISKAAAFNMTQSLRALLAVQGVSVHAVLTGPTDTEMTAGFEIPKASPQAVAQAIFDGVEHGEEDIFPDPMSAAITESWRNGAVKAMETQNATFVAPQPVGV